MKTFNYKCDNETINLLKRISGKSFITHKDFQIIVGNLLKRRGTLYTENE